MMSENSSGGLGRKILVLNLLALKDAAVAHCNLGFLPTDAGWVDWFDATPEQFAPRKHTTSPR